MCICINCKWVDRCKTYHDVERNHEVEHLNSYPDFNAKNQFIHVSLIEEKNGTFSTEWDVRSCESFHEEIGRWSRLNPGIEIPA